MRFFFIALLIALLPLRGWAGHVMAVDMAAQQVAVAHAAGQKSGMQKTDAMNGAMAADCLMFSMAPSDTGASLNAEKPVTSGAQCNNCDTCELCLALATSAHTEWPTGIADRHSALVAVGIGFSSADRASSLKPPIS